MRIRGPARATVEFAEYACLWFGIAAVRFAAGKSRIQHSGYRKKCRMVAMPARGANGGFSWKVVWTVAWPAWLVPRWRPC
jgi:hypothetical protein